MLTRNKTTYPNGITLATTSFSRGADHVDEYHLMFTCYDFDGGIECRIQAISDTFRIVMRDLDITPVFCRWFLSDIANQQHLIPEDLGSCATSIIGQPPTDGSKAGLWVYGLSDVKSHKEGDNFYSVRHGEYSHFWMGDYLKSTDDPEKATVSILTDYENLLKERDCSLLDNCMRTWFFVRDVDVNYKGMVVGRNRVFETAGLTTGSHFIASTGIGGKKAEAREKVIFNAYAVKGLKEGQVNYLKAPSHLNSTMEYGVAFERGTSIDYGDRRHVIISGTASINKYGEIAHRGDLNGQTLRMMENVEKLLQSADAGWEDVCHIIVYLRDFSDYDEVSKIFSEKLPDIPIIIVEAPVCRPGWLIEMECMAVKATECGEYAPF